MSEGCVFRGFFIVVILVSMLFYFFGFRFIEYLYVGIRLFWRFC